jgi:hypothetical protein
MDNLLLNILLIVAILALLIVAGFAVPCLLQIGRAARNLNQTIEMTNRRFPGILQNVEEMTGRLNRQVEDVSSTIRKIQGALGLLVGLEEILRRRVPLPLMKILRLALAVAKGVRVFAAHLMSENPGKRENLPGTKKGSGPARPD